MKRLPLFLAALALVVSVVALLRVPSAADAFAAAKVTNARAGVYGYCDAANGNIQIFSKFNNQNQEPMTFWVSAQENGNRCAITFPFKTKNRVMLATSGDNSPRIISVSSQSIAGSIFPSDVFIDIYDSSGVQVAGKFSLLVY